jgi:hypothetical protein
MAYAGIVVPLPALTGLFLLGLSALPARGQGRGFGADVSHYQGSFGISQSALNQMFAEGRRFIFIKATEGLTGPDDPATARNVACATAEGLLVGVYHFAHPENRPTHGGAVQEADHLLSYAGSAIAPGRLPPVLDLENKAAKLTTSALTLLATYQHGQCWRRQPLSPGRLPQRIQTAAVLCHPPRSASQPYPLQYPLFQVALAPGPICRPGRD